MEDIIMNTQLSKHDMLIINEKVDYDVENNLERRIYNPLFGGRIVTFDMKNCNFDYQENYFKDDKNSTINKIKVFFRSLGKLFLDIVNFPNALIRLNFRNISSTQIIEEMKDEIVKNRNPYTLTPVDETPALSQKQLAGIKSDKLVKELNQMTKELEEAPEDQLLALIEKLEAKTAEVNLANNEYEGL